MRRDRGGLGRLGGSGGSGGSGGRGRRALRLLVVLTVLGAGAACVQIPTGGPVHYGEPSPTTRSSPPVEVIADGPRPGDSPSQIVHGFLEAMRSYQPDFPVAREFLAPSVRELWHPSRIQVYDSDVGLSVTTLHRRQLAIKAPKVAEIETDGSWVPAAASAELAANLRLTRVGGGWRIVNPPDSLIMSRADVDREYARYELFFYDPRFHTLVPDAVYLPVRGNIATLLVQALLRGPSTWLGPAVRTAFPTRSRLAAPSVPVDSGVAQVDLNRRVLDLSDSQRRLMAAQLAWTLQQAGVQRIRVTVEQAPLTVAGKPMMVNVDSWERYDPAVARASTISTAISGGRVVIVDAGGLRHLDSPLGERRMSLRSCAISIYGDRVAAVTANGRRLLEAPASVAGGAAKPPRVVTKGADLLEPSWDRQGNLWVVDRAGGAARITVVTPGGLRRRVRAPDLQGADVRGLAVARDGTRLAALVEEDGRVRLEVGRVLRESGLAVTGLRRVPVPLSSITDVAWADVDQLAVVGHSTHAPPTTVVVSSDGSMMTELGGAPAARTVAAAPGAPLVLGAADGRVYVENEQYRWVARGRGGNPAYPG